MTETELARVAEWVKTSREAGGSLTPIQVFERSMRDMRQAGYALPRGIELGVRRELSDPVDVKIRNGVTEGLQPCARPGDVVRNPPAECAALTAANVVLDAAASTLPEGGVDYEAISSAIDGARGVLAMVIQGGIPASPILRSLARIVAWDDAEEAAPDSWDVDWAGWDRAVAALRAAVQEG